MTAAQLFSCTTVALLRRALPHGAATIFASAGQRTTARVAIKTVSVAGATRLKAPFHQELTDQNCVRCHRSVGGEPEGKGQREKD